MGTPISVPTAGIAQLVKDAYLSCEPYQWAREALVNSLEAGASWVFFGVDGQSLAKTGVARRYVADNGHGMNREQLERFLSMFGGGGKDIGFDANRGVGLKASAFSWNTYGLVFISWTEDEPEGVMVWIHQTEDGIWEQKSWEIFDDEDNVVDVTTVVVPDYDDELGIDFAGFKSKEIEKSGSGVVVLFLGDGPKRDTANGDYTRGEDTVRGIAKYLNSRFLEIDENVTVQVQNLESGEHEDAAGRPDVVEALDGKKYRMFRRNIEGLRSFIPEPDRIHTTGKAKGTVKYPDAHSGVVTFPYMDRTVEVEWFYHPKDAKGQPVVDGLSSGGPAPCIAYRYDQHTKYVDLTEAYVRRSDYHAYRHFGMHEALGELWLIVHAPEFDETDPTQWGLVPQQSRAMLIGIGNRPAFDDMVKEWGDLFWERAGDLKKLLARKATGTESGSDEDREKVLARAMSRLADRMRPVRWFKVVTPKADTRTGEAGDLTEAGRNNRGGTRKPKDSDPKPKPKPRKRAPSGRGISVTRTEVDVDKAGDTPAEERRQSQGLPNVRWDHQAFINAGIPQLAVMFEGKDSRHPEHDAGVVLLNPDFPMFQKEIQYWQETYSKADAKKVRKLVEEVYEIEAVSKITHLNQMKVQRFPSPTGSGTVTLGGTPVWRELTSPAALTAAIVGLVNVESHIRTRAGGRFGTKTAVKVAS